jgi:hypothetical protein
MRNRAAIVCCLVLSAAAFQSVAAQPVAWKSAASATRPGPANSLAQSPAIHIKAADTNWKTWEAKGYQPSTLSSPGEIQPVSFDSFQPIIRAQGPGFDAGVPSVPPPEFGPGPGETPFNCSKAIKDSCEGQAPYPGGFWNQVTGVWTSITQPCGGRKPLESDHVFESFSSPVTNPFYFEDPRALTEIRPIFIYQNVPGDAPIYSGGDLAFFGIQGRLALTERFSLVVNKLGWSFQEVGTPTADIESGNGFSELWLGPKYTFIRSQQTDTLLAGGLTFEIPIGSADVIQDTGSLSLTPYMSFGQGFLESYYGKFHFLNTTGYSFAIDGERTDRLFSSFHLDFDILNQHRFYPFVELNWFLYPRSGDVRSLSFEGRDLINFGSDDVGGNNDLSIAAGMRFNFNRHIQLGGAAEFPLLERKDLMEFRLTFDVILRY